MNSPNPLCNENQEQFREALVFTESVTGFNAGLIEKDYQCSLILHHLSDIKVNHGLIFKGGTCLSKVHADFYRLSEDLGFGLSMELDSPRSQCRRAMEPIKTIFSGLVDSLSHFTISDQMVGAAENRQYNMRLSYDSSVSGQPNFIKIEISLREPIATFEYKPARTILSNPIGGDPIVHPFPVNVLSYKESYAEKFRAALTRLNPAIRDFYDIYYAVRAKTLNPFDEKLLKIVQQKLEIPGCGAVDTSKNKYVQLEKQLDAELKPVLRSDDFQSFDLSQAFEIVSKVASSLGDCP